MSQQPAHTESWLDRPFSAIIPRWNIYNLLVTIIIVLAVVSRFYDLGARVMSHDEVNHVVPSFDLSQGRGYRHDPITHGPFQFHIVALTYFLLGDNDFTSRVPAALFSIAAVAFVLFGFKRYLGRTGSLIAGFLFLISPYMLFYGRYTRNEGFIELFGAVMLYAILRYLDKGDKFSLYLLTATTVLHFTTKETSYIYAAQGLLFIAIIFLEQITRAEWSKNNMRNIFLFLMLFSLVLFGTSLGFAIWNASQVKDAVAAVAPGSGTATSTSPLKILELITLALAIISAGVGLFIMIRTLGWKAIRSQRSFDLLILLGTLIIPLLVAFPVKILGWDPLDYSTIGMIRTGATLGIVVVISVVIGIWWNPKLWMANAVLFYGVFTVLYTTFFTNGTGFFTGIIGSLGYWLSQQGVERGSQPWYFFALIQVPIYEYLAALGTLLAIYFGIRYGRFATVAGLPPASADASQDDPVVITESDSIPDEGMQVMLSDRKEKVPVLALLIFWSFTSLAAYTLAGEKMPWLTVHIALPMLLAAGWGLGYLVDTTPWAELKKNRAWFAVIIIPVFLLSLVAVMGALLGTQRPFQGKNLDQLQATANFLLAVLGGLASGIGLMYFLKDWLASHVLRLVTIMAFTIMAVLTARAAIMASYINYDNAKEFLVYAHAASGPKEVLNQIEEISRRTTNGLDVVVAYDNDMLYPYWWYLRHYPNHSYYGDKPTRELNDAPLIVAGAATMSKLDAIVRENYIAFNYTRMWWPMQDYFNLTWPRVKDALTNPQMRRALFNIWLNRDYTRYSEVTGSKSLTLETWQPSSGMRFYVRKDVFNQVWNYGSAPIMQPSVEVDPYLAGIIQISPNLILDGVLSETGPFISPHGVAVAQDGSIYITDSGNNRIVHFSGDGQFINQWGGLSNGEAPPAGTFHEPWGIAISPDGSVYVADTWNHRIQHFTSDGLFISEWGYFGQGEQPEAMWGPRSVACDSAGRVYVSDTGNKRILVFNADGSYVTQIGSGGMEIGMLDEPVGLAVDNIGRVYVADTWNQRVQVFSPDPSGYTYSTYAIWDVYGWFGQSLENKPYLAVDTLGNVYVTDPEGYRVLEYNNQGQFLQGWGQYSTGTDGFGLVGSIAVAPDGQIWVSDPGNNRVMRYLLPLRK